MKSKIKWEKRPFGGKELVNWLMVPVTNISPFEVGVDSCNKLIAELEKKYRYGVIYKTPSKGIKKTIYNYKTLMEWVQSNTGSNVEIHLLDCEKGFAKIRFGTPKKDEKGNAATVNGYDALKELINNVPEIENWKCLDEEENKKWHDLGARLYHLDQSTIAFEGIPERAAFTIGKEYNYCVCMIDFHWAFLSSLTEIIPEARDYIEKKYWERKKDPSIKEWGVKAIGTMTSFKDMMITRFGARGAYAKLWYMILSNHAEKVHKMVKDIEDQGGMVINYRTDGLIFFWDGNDRPELVGEGPGICEWGYEFYKTSRFRQFSTKKYQFINDYGIMQIKMSGQSRLDRMGKDRSTWDWDDLNNPIIGIRVNRLTHRFEEVKEED